jgi:periplasmic divalent cation tolerance protein
MSASSPALVVLVTAPSADAARIARGLVEQGVAACVNQIGAVSSVYRWQGAVEEAVETLLVIKTRRARYAELEAAVRSLHPYEVPEIIALPIEQGSAAYLQWIAESTP